MSLLAPSSERSQEPTGSRRLLAELPRAWNGLEMLRAAAPAATAELRRALHPWIAAEDVGLAAPAGQALAAMGDPHAIPTVIGLIEADDEYATVYGLGCFALARLTGVHYDEAHDGGWWRKWWEEHRHDPGRFPPEVAALEIPRFELHRPEPPRLRHAGGDPRKAYFLFRAGDPPPPEEASGPAPLLLVLPGGEGSADFRPFVEGLARRAVPRGRWVAELVAPRWNEEQFERIVWPTRTNPFPDMEFATEDLARAVAEDVARKHPVDRERIFVLAWSSGGPAAYTLALGDALPLRGAFIAMSVFRPAFLPPLAGARGRRFWILHSPDDFIPMAFPEAARDALRRAGATVELATYEGGHGWHGDVDEMVRRGLAWLSAQEPGNREEGGG